MFRLICLQVMSFTKLSSILLSLYCVLSQNIVNGRDFCQSFNENKQKIDYAYGLAEDQDWRLGIGNHWWPLNLESKSNSIECQLTTKSNKEFVQDTPISLDTIVFALKHNDSQYQCIFEKDKFLCKSLDKSVDKSLISFEHQFQDFSPSIAVSIDSSVVALIYRTDQTLDHKCYNFSSEKTCDENQTRSEVNDVLKSGANDTNLVAILRPVNYEDSDFVFLYLDQTILKYRYNLNNVLSELKVVIDCSIEKTTISAMPSDEVPDEPNSTSFWMLIMLIALILVIIGVVIYCYFHVKPSNLLKPQMTKKSPQRRIPPTSDNPKPDSKDKRFKDFLLKYEEKQRSLHPEQVKTDPDNVSQETMLFNYNDLSDHPIDEPMSIKEEPKSIKDEVTSIREEN